MRVRGFFARDSEQPGRIIENKNTVTNSVVDIAAFMVMLELCRCRVGAVVELMSLRRRGKEACHWHQVMSHEYK